MAFEPAYEGEHHPRDQFVERLCRWVAFVFLLITLLGYATMPARQEYSAKLFLWAKEFQFLAPIAPTRLKVETPSGGTAIVRVERVAKVDWVVEDLSNLGWRFLGLFVGATGISLSGAIALYRWHLSRDVARDLLADQIQDLSYVIRGRRNEARQQAALALRFDREYWVKEVPVALPRREPLVIASPMAEPQAAVKVEAPKVVPAEAPSVSRAKRPLYPRTIDDVDPETVARYMKKFGVGPGGQLSSNIEAGLVTAAQDEWRRQNGSK